MSEISERWSPELIMKCLEYYYRFPCLWDIYSIDYKNKQKRDNAINEMAAAFNMSIEVMKKKIHSLRNAYINEVAKINRSIRLGAEGSCGYVPKLTWYKFADSFLGKVVRRRKTTSNFGSESSLSSQGMSKVNLPLPGLSRQEESIPEQEIDFSVVSSSPPPTECGSQMTNSNKTKRQKIDSEPLDLESDLLLQEAVNAFRNISASLVAEKNDEIIAFGQNVIAQLGKLPEEYQIKCMCEIQNVITSTRLKYLRSKQSNTFINGEIKSE